MTTNYLQNVSLNIFATMVSKLIGPVFSILVARILIPEDYGIVGIAIALFAFLNIIKDFGISQAIIVNDGSDDFTGLHFTFQLVVSVFCYLLIFLSSDFIASYFEQPVLKSVLLIMGLGLFLAPVEDSLLTQHYKNNDYKIIFYRQLIPSVIGGFSAYIFALLGYGLFSLVYSTLFGSIVSVIFLVYLNRGLPRFELNLDRIKDLLKLGKHILTQKLSGFFVLQFDSIIIAKNLSVHDAGNYRMSMNLAFLIPNAILSQYQQVLFTEASANQSDHGYLSQRYNQFIKLSYAFNFVYVLAVYYFVPILVPTVLGQNWTGIMEPIQMLSLITLSNFIVTPNSQFAQILGFAKAYSYFSVIRSIVTAVTILIASFYSIEIVIITWIVTGIIANIVNYLIFVTCQNTIRVTKLIIPMFLVVILLFVTYLI